MGSQYVDAAPAVKARTWLARRPFCDRQMNRVVIRALRGLGLTEEKSDV
jgi:hypothetical protein